MNDTISRGLLYGGSAAVIAGLLWFGFRKVDADLMTALGAANMQLRIAHGMPPVDKQGQPLQARVQLLASAADNLAAAERQAPDSPMVVEMRGFLRSLQGDPQGAAADYHRARSLPGCEPDQRDTLVFNEARMLAEAGDAKAAYAVFEAAGGNVQPKFRGQLSLEEADLLHRLGRDAEAAQRLERTLADEQDPVAWLRAGQVYVAMGRTEAADRAFAKAATTVPEGDYQRARLKLAAGEIDNCLGLLERAVEAKPAEVRRLLREDADAWRALATNDRFQRMSGSVPAAPGR